MQYGNNGAIGYHDLMQEGASFVELRICLKDPAELVSLVDAFAAVANQFDQYLRREHPNLKGYVGLTNPRRNSTYRGKSPCKFSAFFGGGLRCLFRHWRGRNRFEVFLKGCVIRFKLTGFVDELLALCSLVGFGFGFRHGESLADLSACREVRHG